MARNGSPESKIDGVGKPMNLVLPRIFAWAPQGVRGSAVAIAATRAGGLGFLDLTALDVSELRDFVDKSGRMGSFGIRLLADQASHMGFDSLPTQVQAICLVGTGAGEFESIVKQAPRERPILAEVTTRDAAVSAAAAGVQGIIIAGHEAGGVCGDESSFILLQAVVEKLALSVWVRGGIGPMSAAGCIAAGARGVVLDGALLLTRESPLDAFAREMVSRFDGGETLVGPTTEGLAFRSFALPGSAAQTALKAGNPYPENSIGWAENQAWPVGQDAAFAARMAQRFVTVGGVVRAVDASIDHAISVARDTKPLAENSSLATSHGTRYPIAQGPMTRVSDTAEFAEAVATGGALPFLALAMMSGNDVARLLEETKRRLDGKSWGVGILGFIDPELRNAQVAAIRAVKPPFALIAGGRPDQAAALEGEGIATYLHVPSPGLLSRYLREGARRFVLEGRECGGHVGPRSSMVLWEQAIAQVEEFLDGGEQASPIHLLFAGGIHDGRSAATVATMAAPLAARGVKTGVLIGTAYLFTEEAVGTRAIIRRFQNEAIACRETVLLETGPGHEVRVSPSPFASRFDEERKNLVASGKSADEVRESLEQLNVGRLRIAAKGVDRANGTGSAVVNVADADQYTKGIYMLGQVATLRDGVTTIAELHREICDGSAERIEQIRDGEHTGAAEKSRPSDIAIIGMSSILPGASSAREFWQNTLRGKDAITEVPEDRWDWRLYYDADPKAPDKVTSKWGGFLPDIPFDPLRYGMPPTSLNSIEPVQLLLLEAVRNALDDAGYASREFARERTAVVLGMGGGAAQLAMGYAFRSYLPMLETVAPEAGAEAREKAAEYLPEWTEDSFPGFLLNVAAGRIANRFDLGGANYTVDAACGSSLAAASLAVRELETGTADMVILGGADTVQNPLTYLAFSKTHAFSPRGRCRPFDASADGIVISEGVGVVVLKRLADAERDGDRIYAVIKGLGTSSDGRARGLTAPNPEGQTRALVRAYEKSGVDPATLGYIEAHGTGTAVGDVVEINALSQLLSHAGAEPAGCAVGSVKSMIGHTKCAAGLAGLINASLALHHRTLPPTIGVDELNPKIDLVNGPLRVSTQPRPWFHSETEHPRRAGVSAFGFGGTNFHAVLESYEHNLAPATAPVSEWPAELLLWRAETPGEIGSAIDGLLHAIESGATPRLRDLARTLASKFEATTTASYATLAIVAASLEDLVEKCKRVRTTIDSGERELNDPKGVYFAASRHFSAEDVAFVFPGQGSQSLDMLADLALVFPELRESFEQFDRTLIGIGRSAITPKIFPSTTLGHPAREAARLALMATDVAQPAIGAASVGLLKLLARLGIKPAAVAGHSYGELVALHASANLSVEALAELSEARGRFMNEAAGTNSGSMSALAASADVVKELIDDNHSVVIANHNGPRQTVISGDRDAVTQVVERARSQGIRTFDLPTARAFHSPAVVFASAPFRELAEQRLRDGARIPVYANVDASVHVDDAGEIADRLGRHIASPVRFEEMIHAMRKDGSKLFIEVGPGRILTPLIQSIVGETDSLVVACDAPGRAGIPTLLQLLGRLVAAGLKFRPTELFEGREARLLDLAKLPAGDGSPALPPSTWMVNGSRVRPINGPEPKRLDLGRVVPNGNTNHKLEKSIERNGKNGDHSTLLAGRRNGSMPTQPMNKDKHSSNGTHSVGESTNGHHSAPRIDFGSTDSTPTMDHTTPTSNGHAKARNGLDNLSTSDDARVMEAFQETMRNFLEVQQATMAAYLNRGASAPSIAPPTFAPTAAAAAAAAPTPKPESAASARPVVRPSTPPPTVAKPAALPEKPAVAKPTKEQAIAPPIPSPSATKKATVVDRLLEIVRDRTGYPAEMLKLDLDLEADLGIDSIKRVEILGTLRETVDGLEAVTDSSLMDGLTRAKTLGEIITRVEAVLAKTSPRKAVDIEKKESTVPSNASSIQRLRVEPVNAPLGKDCTGLLPGGTVVITDDGRGVASAVADLFLQRDHRVALIQPSSTELGSPTAVEATLAAIRTKGPIAGLVHALPLRNAAAAGLDPSKWHDRLRDELQGLFHLARATAEDLEAASHAGGSCLIAATALGGKLGSAGMNDHAFAGHGGVAGLVKTLAREWPSIRTRIVDTDISLPMSEIAKQLVTEALTDDGWPEVGYANGKRLRLATVPAALQSHEPGFELRPGDPVLVTGGARGITAAVSLALAKKWRPTLLLLGSSPAPRDTEDPITASLTSATELKAALHGRLRRNQSEVGPADVERAYRALRNERSIRETLRGIRDAGATVEYASADVRSLDALSPVLSNWRKRYGNPVGLVHGAGVIHDKLLRDKTPESFDRVFGTKLDGALNLARLLEADTLKFTALFSSIAGRFGNKGQTDYAAANETLNKLGLWLDTRWKGRVVSFIWGPWSGVGMVSELEGHLGRRGLGMITPDQGCDAVIRELQFGRKGEVEVVIASELGSLDEPLRPRSAVSEVAR